MSSHRSETSFVSTLSVQIFQKLPIFVQKSFFFGFLDKYIFQGHFHVGRHLNYFPKMSAGQHKKSAQIFVSKKKEFCSKKFLKALQQYQKVSKTNLEVFLRLWRAYLVLSMSKSNHVDIDISQFRYLQRGCSVRSQNHVFQSMLHI